jgi:hypothetical protein
MAFVAVVTGIFQIVLEILVAAGAADPGHIARFDVEPGRAMGVIPRVLEMAFGASAARSISGVRERGAPVIGLMAAGALGRAGDDAEGLPVPVAIAALHRAMRSHQRETGLIVLEPGDGPSRFLMAGRAIPAEGPLMKIGMASRAVQPGLEELLVGVALNAADVFMKGEEAFFGVFELDIGERETGCVTVLARFPEFRAVRGRMAGIAVRLDPFCRDRRRSRARRAGPGEETRWLCDPRSRPLAVDRTRSGRSEPA